jgi:SHS2 domain-containing protein
MSMSNKQQRELFESAIHAVYNSEINESEVNSDQISNETSAELDNIEAIVMDYINNAIPNTVNESSSDEELEQEVFEAVQNLNTLCHIVNEYFNYEG